MNKYFNKAVEIVLQNEGYILTNDQDDKGGQTKFGITKKYHPDVDIENLTIERAKQIYKTEYWDKIKGDSFLQFPVVLAIFDFGVNAGIITSLKLAQEACNIVSDGIIGPVSLEKFNTIDPEIFVLKFTLARIKKYVKIVEKDSSQKKFFFGWIRRALK